PLQASRSLFYITARGPTERSAPTARVSAAAEHKRLPQASVMFLLHARRNSDLNCERSPTKSVAHVRFQRRDRGRDREGRGAACEAQLDQSPALPALVCLDARGGGRASGGLL